MKKIMFSLLVLVLAMSAFGGTVYMPFDPVIDTTVMFGGVATRETEVGNEIANIVNSWGKKYPTIEVSGVHINRVGSRIFGVWITYCQKSHVVPQPVKLETKTVTVSAAEKSRIPDVEYYVADQHNYGSDGGFTLIKVTDRQWEFLKKRGLKLRGMGNVLDTPWPPSFGPILMIHGQSEAYWLPDKDRFLEVKEAKPEVFWVAVRTNEDSYKE